MLHMISYFAFFSSSSQAVVFQHVGELLEVIDDVAKAKQNTNRKHEIELCLMLIQCIEVRLFKV